MAFITSGGTVLAYAEAVDVRDKDQRLFEQNEINFTDVPDAPGNLQNYIEDLTQKSTARINQKIRASAQWREYLGFVGNGYDINNIPDFNPSRIISRKSDFTDMCCYYTLKEYLIPKVADFGNPESAEVMKIQYFENKFNDLFNELLAMMDWYDNDADGSVQDDEKRTRFDITRRTRGRRSVSWVR